MKHNAFLIFISCIFLSGCAYKYMPIDMSAVNYNANMDSSSKISIQYSADNIFIATNNAKTAKKLQKKKLYILPLEVENLSANNYNFDDLKVEIFNDYIISPIIEPKYYQKRIKQNIVFHVCYSILGIAGGIVVRNGDFSYNYLSPTLVLPLAGTYNIVKSVKNNKQLISDIQQYDLNGKKFPANSTSFGFVCIKAINIKNLNIRIISND